MGFRPFVYRVAHEYEVTGWVNNSSRGVFIHAEGAESRLHAFYHRLLVEPPSLARIEKAEWQAVPLEDYSNFTIVESERDEHSDVLISPDVATCQDCLSEIRDFSNRHYHYPFTNCTNCGPRYSIIKDVPYDRGQTTMAPFQMCRDCREEYEDPLDRRFHAQPVACEVCGPIATLIDRQGRILPGLGIDQLAQGSILAVKGIGGFHLVCDAYNREAVQSLRGRKERGAKPFAVMARNLEKLVQEVVVTDEEERLLTGTTAPIVVLKRKVGQLSSLPEDLAPGLNTLGMMLPYTPLHHLLFEGPFDFLVMTSANLNGRPLIYKNEEALAELRGIADFFLVHNRDIYHPCDDSVVQMIGGQTVFHRRARGYVPLPLKASVKVRQPILGAGGELKNAFCLAEGKKAFVSQYIGDMGGYENFMRFQQELDSFQRVVQITPQVIAHDAHPDYQTTRFAHESSWPRIPIQHHHAHLISVLGEQGETEPVLGIICDGTGWGEDGKIWGFEFLWGNAQGYQRKGHLEYLPLPGGDAGAKHPLRIAYAYLKFLMTPNEWEETTSLWKGLSPTERKVLDQQLEKNLHVFQTSSAGRLFDAVSALLGICTHVTYEGQAAIELEAFASQWLDETYEGDMLRTLDWNSVYPVDWSEKDKELILNVRPLFKGLTGDLLQHKDKGRIAFQFHQTIAWAIVETAGRLRVGQGPLVINGGVFQNKLLTEMLLHLCSDRSIEVWRARDLPPGDGGLAYGQILIANEVINNVSSHTRKSCLD